MRRTSALALLAILTLTPALASAGGSDTPTLHTARHLAMGGTAIGYVDDATALFHNPAGLGRVERGDIVVGLGVKRATSTGTVVAGGDPVFGDNGVGINSQTASAPIAFLGGSLRVADWLVLGLGSFPVAMGGARYRYEDLSGNVYEDRSVSVYLEISVGVAIDFEELGAPGLTVGITWRPTFFLLSREQDLNSIDFRLTGWGYEGFRIGAQYEPIEELQIGLTWRTRMTTAIADPDAEVGLIPMLPPDLQLDSEVHLPDRIGLGLLLRFDALSFASDIELTLSSKNVVQPFRLGPMLSVDQVLAWQNEWTWRLGGEYVTADGRLPLRVGYIYDGITTNKYYPSAFGTPPSATHVFTLGAGYQQRGYSVNLAFAHRRGEVDVVGSTPAPGQPGYVQSCAPLCGGDGRHAIVSNELFVDVSRTF